LMATFTYRHALLRDGNHATAHVAHGSSRR
jgi:hypothetical protein